MAGEDTDQAFEDTGQAYAKAATPEGLDLEHHYVVNPDEPVTEEAVDDRGGKNQEQQQIHVDNEGAREEDDDDDGGGVRLPMAQIQMQNLSYAVST